MFPQRILFQGLHPFCGVQSPGDRQTHVHVPPILQQHGSMLAPQKGSGRRAHCDAQLPPDGSGSDANTAGPTIPANATLIAMKGILLVLNPAFSFHLVSPFPASMSVR